MACTKIVATLGPASEDEATVSAMIKAGLDVVRMNMSHGTHEDHARRIALVRRLAASAPFPLAILADLQGPKLRIGELTSGSAALVNGAAFTLTTEQVVGDATIATAPYPELPQDAKVGDRILLADGNLELRVTGTTAKTVETVVVHGGVLRSHQGVNLPGVATSLQSLTTKDRADLEFVLQQEVDYIALSFVRHPRDVQELRYALLQHGSRTPIVAKIEKAEAIDNIDGIIAAADAIMVARGDLGVEVPAERVPLLQKMIIRKARLAAKPVITATQMLESMISNPRPTRAEASDVANAILDGTDAIMLSGETAIGKFPVLAVQMMDRIATETEPTLDHAAYRREAHEHRSDSVTDAISQATVELAADLDVSAILAATATGRTVRAVARWRPRTTIVGITPEPGVARALALVWGAFPICIEPCPSTEMMVQQAMQAAVNAGFIKPGEQVVMTAGLPLGVSGQTNSVQVRVAPTEDKE